MTENNHINTVKYRKDDPLAVNDDNGAILNLNGDALRQMLSPLLVIVATNNIERQADRKSAGW